MVRRYFFLLVGLQFRIDTISKQTTPVFNVLFGVIIYLAFCLFELLCKPTSKGRWMVQFNKFSMLKILSNWCFIHYLFGDNFQVRWQSHICHSRIYLYSPVRCNVVKLVRKNEVLKIQRHLAYMVL